MALQIAAGKDKKGVGTSKTEGAGLLAAAATLNPAAQHPCHCRRQTAKPKGQAESAFRDFPHDFADCRWQ
jgi:hypothetical protein